MNVYIVVGIDYENFEILKIFTSQIKANLYKDEMIEKHLKYKEETDAFYQKVKGKAFLEYTDEEKSLSGSFCKKYENATYKSYEVLEKEVEE